MMALDMKNLFKNRYNPFPSTGAAVGGLPLTKMMISIDEARSSQIKEHLIDNILIKANRGSASPGDTRVFALIGNVGKGKTHLVQHIIHKTRGEDVVTVGLEVPSLSNIYTIYTIPHSPTQMDATSNQKIYSWLLSRIVNVDDDPQYEMGMAYSPSMPESKRNEFIDYVNSLYKKETGHGTIRELSRLSFEQFFKILEGSSNEALKLSGKKGIFLIFDEMEAPIENLAQNSQNLVTFIESLRELTDRVTQSKIPLYIAFCFTIQPWTTLEKNTGIDSVQAFVSRLAQNKMILQVSFTEDEIEEFIKQSIKISVLDKNEYSRIIKQRNLSTTYPFCSEAPRILRRYLRGEPRSICQICNLLFNEWLEKDIEINASQIKKTLDGRVNINTDLFRTLCDRLGDRNYIIRIIKDYSTELEFSKEELFTLVSKYSQKFGVAPEQERIEADLDKISSSDEDILAYDEERQMYSLGYEFQQIYGYEPSKSINPAFNPSMHVELKLKQCKQAISNKASDEKRMLLAGLQNIFMEMGRESTLKDSAVLAKLPENISGLYYPIIGKITKLDVEMARDLASSMDADTIIFFGRIRRTGSIDDEAKELMNSAPHPKTEIYRSKVKKLKDVCRMVGTQEDYDFIEKTFINVPLKDAISFLDIYRGNKIIQQITAETQFWIMAYPDFLDGVPQEDQDVMANYREQKIRPSIVEFLQDESVSKIRIIRNSGEIDAYLPTKTNEEDIQKVLRDSGGQSSLFGGLSPSVISRHDTKLRKIINLGILTQSYGVPTTDHIRSKNPVVWLIVRYIEEKSPTQNEIFSTLGVERKTKERILALINILEALGMVKNEDGKIVRTTGESSNYLKQTHESVSKGLGSIKSASIEIDKVMEKKINEDLSAAKMWLKGKKTGKKAEPPMDLMTDLTKDKEFLTSLYEEKESEAKAIVADYKPQEVDARYSDFSKGYSAINIGSKELIVPESALDAYIKNLIEIDPPFSDLCDIRYPSFKKAVQEMENKLHERQYGLIIGSKDGYAVIKNALESAINKNDRRLRTNIAQFSSDTNIFIKKINTLSNAINPDLDFLDITPTISTQERGSYVTDINQVITKRLTLLERTNVLLDALEEKINVYVDQSKNEMVALENKLLELETDLKKHGLLRPANIHKVNELIRESKESLEFVNQKDELVEMRKKAKPGLFEQLIVNEIPQFFSNEVDIKSRSGRYVSCGPGSEILNRIDGEIAKVPEVSLDGPLLDLYRSIKVGNVRSKEWIELELKYGSELYNYVAKLMRFDLIRIM